MTGQTCAETTVVDAQIHIWPPESAARPWLKDAATYAHGPSLSPETVLEHMTAASVDRAVLVPPSWEGDRNDYCSAAAARWPGQFAYMARLDLAHPDVMAHCEEARHSPGFRGIRLTFRKGESRELFLAGGAEWLWKTAERDGIPVCIYVPGLLSHLHDIVRRHPGLKLCIDHFGLPLATSRGEATRIVGQLADLAIYENVMVKATCLPNGAPEQYPFPSLHPLIRHVLDAYGSSRIFWGSDLSRLRCSYDECRRLFRYELPFLTGADRNDVMGGAIVRWLGWT
jgi:L-fuconolactonase